MIKLYTIGNSFFIEKGDKKYNNFKIDVKFDNNIVGTDKYNVLIKDKIVPELSGQRWSNFTNNGTPFASQAAFKIFVYENTGFKTASGGSGAGGEIYNPYGTIALMLADQVNQTDQQIIKVTDASADANITFAVGETRLQAYYTYLGTTTGTMADYELISAPYGNHTGSGDYLYNVLDYGAKGDGVQLLDGAITASDATFTSATASFVSSDIGKVIHIKGAGASGGYLTTTIASINSGTSVELTANAPTTVSGATYVYGTDDTEKIQDAINACFDAKGGTVYVPNGIYIINGALRNSVVGNHGTINYNSQLIIPDQFRTDIKRSSITILGETIPHVAQSAGIGTAIPSLAGAVLLSTISGSGTEPSVICSRGYDTGIGPYVFNWCQTNYQNLSILTTPNSSNRITVGGINCFQSLVSRFEDVTVFGYDLNLVNSAEPNVTVAVGISMPKVNCTKHNLLKHCSVGGMTYGYKMGEHSTVFQSSANACLHGFYETGNNHENTYIKMQTPWCKYGISWGSSESYINIHDWDAEYRSNGAWYDTVSHINDSGNKGFGVISSFHLVEASVGANNGYFIKNGGKNITSFPISTLENEYEITSDSIVTQLDQHRKNTVNTDGLVTLTVPLVDHTSDPPYNPNIGGVSIYYNINIGTTRFVAASGVTINSKNGLYSDGQYAEINLVCIGVNEYILTGDLTDLELLEAPILGTPSVTSTTEIEVPITDNNTSPNEASTQMEYKLTSGSTWVVHGSAAQDATTYSYDGLSVGVEYDFRAKAISSGAGVSNSGYSNIVSETTDAGVAVYAEDNFNDNLVNTDIWDADNTVLINEVSERLELIMPHSSTIIQHDTSPSYKTMSAVTSGILVAQVSILFQNELRIDSYPLFGILRNGSQGASTIETIKILPSSTAIGTAVIVIRDTGSNVYVFETGVDCRTLKRFKIKYDFAATRTYIYYWNGSSWTEIDAATAKVYNLHAGGGGLDCYFTIQDAASATANDIGHFDDFYLHNADYTTETPS